jgi:hypothetical protein
MMRLLPQALVLAALCALVMGQGQARGGSVISVTFDEPQLVDNDPLLTFYDGGMTFLGIGGGPNLGVSFTINARVRVNASGLVGSFTQPGIMELINDNAREGEGIPATMNVASGFSSLMAFNYAAIDAAGEMKIYSGPDGTGTLLSDTNLPVTSPMTGPGIFVTDQVAFSGVAQSVVFSGGNKQIAFDDLLLGTPEPPAWQLLAIGALCCGVMSSLRLRRGRARHAPI